MSKCLTQNVLRSLLASITPRPAIITEAGCGDARVVAALCEDGFQCQGFDHSPEMIELGKLFLAEYGLDPTLIRHGDIYEAPAPDRSSDAVVCLGVLEILPDHERIFREFRRILKPGGWLVLSLGNELFSLFSMNRHTVKFLDRLLADAKVPEPAAASLCKNLGSWLNLNAIENRQSPINSGEIKQGQVSIPSYNPLNIAERLMAFGFEMDALRFYHYHPLPPRMEASHEDLFRGFAESLETEDYDWRGGILCNAMVIRARMC
jgi:SAM-dependent methyltransferase